VAGLRGGEWQAAGRPRDGAAVRIQGLPLRNSQYGHTVAVTVACSTAIRSTMRSRAHQFSKIQIGDAAAPRPRNCARPSSRSARQHYSLWPQCCSMPALTHSSPLPILHVIGDVLRQTCSPPVVPYFKTMHFVRLYIPI
jgi:hypothetical protein